MHRYLIAGVLVLMLAAPAMAQEACGDSGAVFPGLGSSAEVFGIAPSDSGAAADEGCGDAIQMDVEPRPGMLVKLAGPPQAEELVCAVTSKVIKTYRARHGNVNYLIAPASGTSDDAAAGTSIRIAHVITSDPNYVSPEGLRVGDTVARALALTREKGSSFTSGGLCLMLPSGWTACFDPKSAGVTPGGLFALAPDAPIMDFYLM